MKKLIGSLLISTAVIGFSIQVSAADEDVKIDKNTNQIDSKATIKVNPGAEVPTKPEDTDKPSGETGQNGPLSIDNVIVFNFDDMNLKGTTQKISLQNDGKESTANRNIQITDNRGTGDGWNLQIKQSPLKDGSKELKGAYIAMSKGLVVPGNSISDTDKNNVDVQPEAMAYDAGSASKGTFAKLVVANKEQGLGTYKVFYNQDENGKIKDTVDDIQLVVPSGSKIGDYKGTVTWALSDSPTAIPADK